MIYKFDVSLIVKKCLCTVAFLLLFFLLYSCVKVPYDKVYVSSETWLFQSSGGEALIIADSKAQMSVYESDANWRSVKEAKVAPSSTSGGISYALDWLTVSRTIDQIAISAQKNTSGQYRYAIIVLYDPLASLKPAIVHISQSF